MTRKHGVVVAPPSTAPAAVGAKAPPPAPARAGFLQAWKDFWFTPVCPLGLHSLRVLAGLLFLAWLLPLAGAVEALFGLNGWFDREAYLEASRFPTEISLLLNWSLLYFFGPSLYWFALAVWVLFTLGVATRITAPLTWLLVVSFLANPASRYDADYLLGIVAFYLMIGYLFLGQWSLPLSPLGRVFGTRTSLLLWPGVRAGAEPASYAANLAVRLLQVHFALIVVASALHKLQFGAWWSGTAFWYPLNSPLSTTEAQIRALIPNRERYLLFLSVMQYAVLAWQLSFPFFAWRQGWLRLILLGGAALGWVGCWFVYQIPLFGPIYAIGCLSYLTPQEWLVLWTAPGRLLTRYNTPIKAALLLAGGLAYLSAGCAPTDSTSRKPSSNEPAVAKKEQEHVAPPVEPTAIKGPSERVPVLQTRIDAALKEMHNRVLLRENSFWTVFHQILGIGPESAYLLDHRTGERVKSLDYICSGGALRGLQFVNIGPGRADVVTMPGSGTGQGHQDQFIAEMAQWGMSRERKIVVQGKEVPFEAFIFYSRERTSVKAKQELSWAIIIISTYYGTNVSWTNKFGETLHFEDVVRYEMHEPIKDGLVCGGTHRLFGLSWAYHVHMKEGGQKTAVWQELVELTNQYKELAHQLQNKDGSFSTSYFRGPGNEQSDLTLRIHSTGHILEWLALALSDEELRQPWMESAAEALAVMILNNRDQGLDGGAVYHAAHGLEIYRNRVFGPTPHPPAIPLPPR